MEQKGLEIRMIFLCDSDLDEANKISRLWSCLRIMCCIWETFVLQVKIMLKPWPSFLAPQGPYARSCRNREHVRWRGLKARMSGLQKSAELRRKKPRDPLRDGNEHCILR